MKLKKLTRSLALVGLGSQLLGVALAQTTPTAPVQKVERVEVTGSSIKRLANEGAVPIQVITASDLNAKGITSAEEMLRQLAANGVGADNATSNNNVFGSDTDRLTGGASNANLRGLGPSSTLVLLNGRRIAAQGMSGGAVDLNAIPMAAVSRIEVLKDGASAIYGTDAIGGVINFILKKDMEGVDVKVDWAQPLENSAGTTRRASITGGIGSLERDKFNLMASLTLDKNDILRGSDREWANGFQPDRFLSPDSSSHPFANVLGNSSTVAGTALGGANGTTGSTVGTGDPLKYTRINLLALAGQAGCDSIDTGVKYQPQLWNATVTPAVNASTKYLCNTDYGAQYMLAPAKEAYNLVTRGNLQIADNHTAFIELSASRSEVTAELVPSQFSTTNASGTHYPVNGPYYLNLKNYGVNEFDPTKPIAYRWRMQDFGYRTQEQVAENARLLVGVDGTVGEYDYKLGLSTAKGEAWTNLVDGYAYLGKLVDALKTGTINPWVKPGEKQTQAAMDLIESTKARGKLQGGETTLQQFDGAISGNLMKLPAGPLDFAVGFDLRKESFKFAPETGSFTCSDSLAPTINADNPVYANIVYNCPGNTAIPKMSRDVNALYGELAVPVMKGLDLQLAIRYDKYSDFGGTTNPKIAFRYQPNDVILFRGSVNTGFRAPSFQQLALNTAPLLDTADFSDPVLCPTDPTQCAIRLNYTNSGNPGLSAEKSKQGTLGIVLSPVRDLTMFADYWRVDLDERIKKLTLGELKANYNLFAEHFLRDPATNKIRLVEAGWINAADSSTQGLDYGASYALKLSSGLWTAKLDGTHMISHKERAIASQPLQQYVGAFGLRTLYLKDKFSFDIGWAGDAWATTFSTIYKSGYKDQDMTRFNIPLRDIPSYTTFNLFGSYTGVKNLTLTAGLRNLFDKAPNFTYHNVDDVVGAGWDPRVADPFGRTLVLSASYSFR
ncbi:TonB-dependent receptor domain-containing protein [Roseateles violae]|uniref:TonB-dependent receptor n=1 Tax=Roseateles violae TaxID=3058042 RepID=A0ABT8DT02_9BURK|nr:TonB-dependent receptor [Pelomonas sp. PFR6]MDN3919439.1 TonB-dependent receptor [Pelomonas sp. PFR6]